LIKTRARDHYEKASSSHLRRRHLCRRLRSSRPEYRNCELSPEKQSGRLRGAAPPGSASAASSKAQSQDAGVHAFTPGRPFAKGHAREWILDLASSLGGDRRGDAVTMMNLTPVFLTMDEDSVTEAMAAIQELIVIENAKNLNRRRNPNGDGKFDTLMMLSLIRMAQTNPEDALAFLKREPNHNDGTTMMLVFGRLAADDPQRAEQLALSMDKKEQRDALLALTFALINKDPLAALALAERYPETLGGGKQREQIFEVWVKRDPKTAMAAAVQETAKTNDPELVRNTIEEWCKTDPAAAAQWANAHEGPGRVIARAMVLERRARDEPQGVL
jgi:hypothetical protein